MSGDLEDFLRRAAQRRQAKTAQQQQSQPAQRPRPQYTDQRTERVARIPDQDEILTAEIVEEDSFAARRRRLEAAKQAATKAEAEAAEQMKRVAGSKHSTAPVILSGNPAQDLLKMLKRPGGIQQAILLREIFDRPEHRW